MKSNTITVSSLILHLKSALTKISERRQFQLIRNLKKNQLYKLLCGVPFHHKVRFMSPNDTINLFHITSAYVFFFACHEQRVLGYSEKIHMTKRRLNSLSSLSQMYIT